MKLVRGTDLTFEPASHEDKDNPGVYKKVLFKRDDLIQGVIQMVNWSMMPVGGTFQNHYHESLVEVFVITKGAVKGKVDDTEIELQKGDALRVDKGERHTMTNITDDEVEYVVFGISDGEGKTVIV